MIACVKPNRLASATRRPTAETRRTSPASPTSPIATVVRGVGLFVTNEFTASAMPRSAAGSVTFIPPTVDR